MGNPQESPTGGAVNYAYNEIAKRRDQLESSPSGPSGRRLEMLGSIKTYMSLQRGSRAANLGLADLGNQIFAEGQYFLIKEGLSVVERERDTTRKGQLAMFEVDNERQIKRSSSVFEAEVALLTNGLGIPSELEDADLVLAAARTNQFSRKEDQTEYDDVGKFFNLHVEPDLTRAEELLLRKQIAEAGETGKLSDGEIDALVQMRIGKQLRDLAIKGEANAEAFPSQVRTAEQKIIYKRSEE